MRDGIVDDVTREGLMGNDELLSGSAVNVRLCHHLLTVLIKDGQYEQAFALLHRDLSTESNIRDCPLFSHILSTANYLFTKCQHFHDEVEWYRQAYLKAQAQERELQKELHVLLSLLNDISFSMDKEQNKSDKLTL
jgi:hypothetical protein